ncbi:FtsK/SpoIIIE family DNA translocase [Prosthecomicrobium sp. N25]|uniref:FtsK/SpoIIIE family DNA translocase n=1 Tax=Prosthecomicrobium sp. N25 TaxID=3129254 RepID=UPI003077F5A5
MRSSRTDAGSLTADTDLRQMLTRNVAGLLGVGVIGATAAVATALATWSVTDPSYSYATQAPARNLLGYPGAVVADLAMQLVGLAATVALLPALAIGWRLLARGGAEMTRGRLVAWCGGTLLTAAALAGLPVAQGWPLPVGLGGVIGDMIMRLPVALAGSVEFGRFLGLLGFGAAAILANAVAIGWSRVPGRASPRDRALARDFDDEEDDGEESRFMPLAMLHHWVLVARANLMRLVGRRGGFLDARRYGAPLGAMLARRAPDAAVEDDEEAYRPVALRGRPPRLEPGFAPEPARRAPVAPEAVYEDDDVDDEPEPEPIRRLEPTVRGPRIEMPRPLRGPASRIGRDEERWEGPEAAEDEGPEAYDEAPPVRFAPRDDSRVARQPEPRFEEPVEDDEEDSYEAPQPSPGLPSRPQARQPVAKPPVARPLAAERAGAPGPGADKRVPVDQMYGPMAQVKRPSRETERHERPDGAPYQFPPVSILAEPRRTGPAAELSEDVLEGNAGILEGVLDDFGVKGEIIHVRPGPVVTLYELEPAPGVKSSRVIGLADDIARSMSAISARVAVVPGRNVIGIELPNQRRETVYFREMISSQDFETTKHKLALCLGKTIGGEPVIVDLARMPHLLVAGTTGSGKSVAMNTMILSLLYRLTPEQCKLIMIDPKMLELSVYDGIPHLLTPVVTDPKKAVMALKWAVREMEDRYRKMSKLGVRNIDGFNARVAEAKARGEVLTREVQTGFHRQTGEPIYEQEQLALDPLPYIVVLVDEMADLMIVAGKEIEGAIQRLAQMARAAGIHIVMATQRPSVDVITGTIKANFPTRISFQVTSKIDSRTILGEQGAEQLLGQGDMLYMAGGGRIQRVHGPFVADDEVEKVVVHLKRQGKPQYLEAITAGEEEVDEAGAGDEGSLEDSKDLYDRAVAVVLKDKKASTSYVQRRLQIGYNRAASLIERMEKEGIVGPPNHSGKREILIGGGGGDG